MKITMTAVSERERARFYLYKKQKIGKHFYIKKARHFAKSKITSIMFLYTKSKTL